MPSCQKLPSDEALAAAVLTLQAGPPTREIYDFTGDVTLYDETFEGGCEHAAAARSLGPPSHQVCRAAFC